VAEAVAECLAFVVVVGAGLALRASWRRAPLTTATVVALVMVAAAYGVRRLLRGSERPLLLLVLVLVVVGGLVGDAVAYVVTR
jgi:hypothetical protein